MRYIVTNPVLSGQQEAIIARMNIAPFETERFFAHYEFSTPYQLCNSDCESISISELLSLAGGSLEEFGRERLIYTETQGNPELRKAIAGMYQSVTADDVIVLGTPVEGIYLTARTLLEPGDEVVVLTPAYDALINMFEHVVGEQNVKRWEFKGVAGSWQLNLDELRGLITGKTRMLVVNFPHNPTGYLPTLDFQQALAKLVEEHDLWLFCDEMYLGLNHAGTPAIPSAADITEKSITLSGLSKTYGLPGLRCGWLTVQDPALRENIINWKHYTSICAPVPSEYLSLAALRVWEVLRDRNIARIHENLELADAFFDRWPNLFTWYRPLSGSTALIRYNVPSVSAVAEVLAEQEGVLIQPAGMLGGDDQHMRFGFGRDSFGVALARFEDWLKRESTAA